MSSPSSDPLVVSSRREARFAVGLWFVAAAYTVGYCATFGYERAADELTFVYGIPDWVFWGIVAPWTVCTIVSVIFALCWMRDDPLGDEAASDPAHADETSPAADASELVERRDA